MVVNLPMGHNQGANDMMKRRVLFLVVLMAVVLFMMACAPEPVSEHDLEMVNFYAQSSGAEPIALDAAEEMNKSLMKNAQTGDVKTSWQLLVDYVINANSEEHEPLDYEIAFDGETYTMTAKSSWERVGE